MDAATRERLLDEYEQHSRVVKAAEPWGKEYKRDEASYLRLIKIESKLERQLKSHFRTMADNAERYVNWYNYDGAIRAYDVNVIVNDEVVSESDGLLFTLIFDTIADAVSTGAKAGQAIYKMELGIEKLSTVIQRAALEQTAGLVGKRVLEDGSVIDNPNAAYRVSDKVRQDIRQAIQTSIALGEDQQAAVKRLREVINTASRAEMIARTEAVNGYGRGLMVFGNESGAVGKEWESINTKDRCGEYARRGPVPVDYVYDVLRGITEPAAHPNCRCGLRLIYQNELDVDPQLFSRFKEPPEPPKPKAKTDASKKKAEPAPPVVKTSKATFVKAGRAYDFETNAVETAVIAENKIDMHTGPQRGRSRWAAGMQGFYVEYGDGVKAMHMRNPAAEAARHVFYHEIGHAIDKRLRKDGYLRNDDVILAAIKKDAKAVYETRVRRDYKDLTDDQKTDLLAGKPVYYTKKVGSRDATFQARIRAAWKSYAMSPSEIWADAYGQWRLNPKQFAEYAPALAKIFEEL